MEVSRLREIEDLLIDDRTKGIPGGVAPFRLGDIGSQSWNLLHEDLPLPVAILKASALAHNGKWMASFLELSGAVISPHGKTTMSPQLFERQLDDGAWAVTVATVHQIQVCRRYGFSRIVLANQLVGRQAIRFVLDELRDDPDFDFYCLVDSVDGVETLAAAARAHPVDRPVKVLLEGGMPGGRTGCRNLDAALAVAHTVKAAAPHVALHGVEGFEGLIQADSLAEQEAKVAAFLDFLAEIAMVCQGENLFAEGPIVLSAGGSAFYDMVLDRFRRIDLGRETMLLTRSGCYLSHDSAMYRQYFERVRERADGARGLGEGLRPALQLWTYVQSRPESEKIILTMGRRDVSFDADMPVPELWYRPGTHANPVAVAEGCTVTELNDQHTHLNVPAQSPFRVGDMMGFGISHPCTTFDKWQLVCIVDDDYTVVSAIRTFF
jgi:D-serine dehydratase